MTGQTIILGTERAIKDLVRVAIHAPPGSVATVAPPRRTQAQNDKMWAMLSDISRAKPEGRVKPPHKWKAIFMDACGHKPEYDDNLEQDGFICLGYKSSRLTKEQMSDIIECIYEYGSRHGVVWSEPTAERRAA